ncbi:MAG: hypothetical protein JWS10_918 [Cypionkella sp.]|uniref:TIGR04255 family protein n=1 Tax=Cypionkella sp. TaxID=2811411 RepID=UPI0026261967|nr:TIGR04255 family protein [Cypionkella sp.]MDB5658303.1 hypothetical protein [Cypionkella sp.]
MTWAPLHLSHAVERVRFEIVFSEPLPTKLVDAIGLALDARRTELRFENREPMHVQNFVVGGDIHSQPVHSQVQSGWQAIRKSSPTVAMEAVVLNSGRLVYESTDYRGWVKAFSRFKNVCSSMLEDAGRAVNASAVVHDYMDRFIFDGPANLSTPTDLIRHGVLALMPQSVLSGNEMWHTHRGWFEHLHGEKYLINQNLDAQDGTTPYGKIARSIQIYTKLELRAEAKGLDLTSLPSKFDIMHNRCNQLVGLVITEKAADKIGLLKGSDANV